MHRLSLLAAALLVFSACDSNDEDPVIAPIEAKVATDIVADQAPRDPTTGREIGSTNRYTLYSLRTNRVVLSYTNPVRTDSNSTAWDIGFKGTTIIVNGGTSGPGQAAAVVATGVFDSFNSVSESTVLRVDGDAAAECPGSNTPSGPRPGTPRAICTGSDNGWYNYNGAQNLITPLAGRTILVRTADGQGYAKVQIQSYYLGAPVAPVTTGGAGDTPDRTYTFRYVLNPAGRTFLSES